MRRTHVESSVIRAVGFERGTLEIEFVSGALYHYYDVPDQVHRELLAAESHGTYFNARVRDRFAYRQLA